VKVDCDGLRSAFAEFDGDVKVVARIDACGALAQDGAPGLVVELESVAATAARSWPCGSAGAPAAATAPPASTGSSPAAAVTAPGAQAAKSSATLVGSLRWSTRKPALRASPMPKRSSPSQSLASVTCRTTG
jgi:hypothetical protein